MRQFPSTRQFYSLYIENMRAALKEYEVKYLKLKSLAKAADKQLEGIRPELENAVHKLDKAGLGVDYLLTKKGKSSINALTVSDDNSLNAYVRTVLFDWHTVHTYKTRMELKVKQYQLLSQLTLEQYTFLIENINDKVANEIIQGYRHDLGHGLGTYRIVADRKLGKTANGEQRRMVDWEASNKAKKALIDAGKTPKHSVKAPDGEPWLVFRTVNHRAFLQWIRRSSPLRPQIDSYTFGMEAPESRNPIIPKLYKALESNPLLHLKYI